MHIGPLLSLNLKFKSSISWMARKLRGRPSVPRERRRLSDVLMSEYRGTVQYGPLTGYKIPTESHWGALARPAMLLGLYEREVVSALVERAKNRDILIDVGAADGFFAVGLVASGVFRTSFAFEISASGRQIIKKSCQLNGVLDDVEIYGKFDEEFLLNADNLDLTRAVVLIDIEGDEFSLLDSPLIHQLREAIIVVELHDFHFEDGAALKAALIDKLQVYFELSTVTTGERSLPRSDFLDELSDNERWLLCSEGRARRMEWLIASPRCQVV